MGQRLDGWISVSRYNREYTQIIVCLLALMVITEVDDEQFNEFGTDN